MGGTGIGKPGKGRWQVTGQTPLDLAWHRQRAKLDMGTLPADEYEVLARIRRADGRTIGKPSKATVVWPGRAKAFEGVRVLNNLVWELARISPGEVTGLKRIAFQSPLRRWAYVSCTARVGQGGRLSISIPSIPNGKDMIVVTGPADGTFEAMRPLPAGKHELQTAMTGAGTVERLVIRSIPELIYAQYGSNPHTTEFGPYTHVGEDPDYGTALIDKHVLPNVNTLVFSSGQGENPFLKRWHARGGRSLFHCTVPKYRVKTKDGWKITTHWPSGQEHELTTPDEAYQYIANTVGFAHPGLGGSIADEFGNSEDYCTAYAQAVRKLAATPEYRERVFYPYANHLYTGPEGIELIEALVAADSTIAWKRYLKTQADEQAARHFLQQELIDRSRTSSPAGFTPSGCSARTTTTCPRGSFTRSPSRWRVSSLLRTNASTTWATTATATPMAPTARSTGPGSTISGGYFGRSGRPPRSPSWTGRALRSRAAESARS